MAQWRCNARLIQNFVINPMAALPPPSPTATTTTMRSGELSEYYLIMLNGIQKLINVTLTLIITNFTN